MAAAVDSRKMNEIECKICSKKFDSEESLEQHNKSKHPVTEKKSRNFKRYFILLGLIIAIIIISLTFYIRAQAPGKYDNFAQCLTEKGAIIYGNDYCQYTNQQLNFFGKSKKYLDYVKCIDNKELCDSKGVEITPTWEINGQILEGVQSFERLSTLSGCEM